MSLARIRIQCKPSYSSLWWTTWCLWVWVFRPAYVCCVQTVTASSLIWLRLALQLTGCRKHAETQCTHDNSLQNHSGCQRHVPLINGGGKESRHTTHNGVPNVPKRKNANNSRYNASGEQEWRWTTPTCSSPPTSIQSATESLRSSPFWYTFDLSHSISTEVLARGLIGTCA